LASTLTTWDVNTPLVFIDDVGDVRALLGYLGWLWPGELLLSA
jgi:hypothetical protein